MQDMGHVTEGRLSARYSSVALLTRLTLFVLLEGSSATII